MKLRDIMNTIPREILAPLPTPLQRLQNTEKLINSENKMYIKRDDLTGVGSGGNKVRCMEYIIGRAKADGCVGVLASGNGQSNLCSLAAASAAKAGMKCYIVHNSDKPEVSVGNALLITGQLPEAKKLADFDTWKAAKCFIKKGETGILLLEPGEEFQREDGGIGVNYNAKRAFDISQTTSRQL